MKRKTEREEKNNEQSEKKQWILVELFLVTFVVVYSIFRACILWVLPKRYKDISRDIILITGGGKGIGRLLAMELAKHKPRQIILWGRNEDTLRATAKAVKLNNVPCTYMVCDVSDREMVYKKATEINETIGDVTMLINNAGIVFGNNIVDSNDCEIQKTMDTNTVSHFYTIKAFLPGMLEKDHGHIVTISSMLSFIAMPGCADYVASKHACMGMTDCLQLEIAAQGKEGLHITSVHPYLINTDMFAGVKTRFDWLMPALDKEYVAWKTVDAILTNQHQVLMPRIMYLLPLAKSIMPVEALKIVYKFMGASSAMETFHARKRTKTL